MKTSRRNFLKGLSLTGLGLFGFKPETKEDEIIIDMPEIETGKFEVIDKTHFNIPKNSSWVDMTYSTSASAIFYYHGNLDD